MRVYVLVRKDLDYSSVAVQGGHALAELCQNHDLKEWIDDHKTLIYLGVRNEIELLDYFKMVPIKEKTLFREPDMRNECTALAILIKSRDDQKLLKKLQLL
jgi:hypothetical protein